MRGFAQPLTKCWTRPWPLGPVLEGGVRQRTPKTCALDLKFVTPAVPLRSTRWIGCAAFGAGGGLLGDLVPTPLQDRMCFPPGCLRTSSRVYRPRADEKLTPVTGPVFDSPPCTRWGARVKPERGLIHASFRAGCSDRRSVMICNSTVTVATRCEPAHRGSDPLHGGSRSQ